MGRLAKSSINRRSMSVGLALASARLTWPAITALDGTHPAFAVEAEGSVKLAKEFDLPTRGAATAVTWTSDGSALAAASWYGEDLTVWDRSGSVRNTLKRIGGGPYPENSLAFVNGSSALLFPPPQTSDNSACLDVWDAATGIILKTVPGPDPDSNNYARNRARHFVVSADQSIAAAAPTVGGNVAIYKTKNWARTGAFKSNYAVASLALFPDGQRLAVGGLTQGHFLVVDTASARIIADFAAYVTKFANISVGTVAVSPDAEFVVTGIGLTTIPGEYYRAPEARTWDQLVPPAVSVWRVSDGSHVAGFGAVQHPVRQIAWDPKNRFVAFVDSASTLFIWQPSAAKENVQQILLSGDTMSVAVDPRGDRLAVTYGGGVRVYRIQ
jgi:WD40 repeat protein